MTTLNWHETWDVNDNSIWEANSPYEEGFQWRLKQLLFGNRIIWVEAHDADLFDAEEAEMFSSLEEAQAFVLKEHIKIIESNFMNDEPPTTIIEKPSPDIDSDLNEPLPDRKACELGGECESCS